MPDNLSKGFSLSQKSFGHFSDQSARQIDILPNRYERLATQFILISNGQNNEIRISGTKEAHFRIVKLVGLF